MSQQESASSAVLYQSRIRSPLSPYPVELAILSDEIALDLEESLLHGAEFGFKKYEIRCVDDYAHRIPDLLPGRIGRLEELVSSGEIEITALSPGLFKIPLSQKEQLERELHDGLPRTCALAKLLGAERVIVFGFLRESGDQPEAAVRHLKTAAAVAADHGVQLLIENEPGSFCDTGVNSAAIMRAINQRHVGINWDAANAVFSGEAAYPIGYEAALPFIRNVHLKDGIPIPPDKWENRLLGDGGVNWVGQLAALLRDRPVDHLTLETHVFPLLSKTRENLRRLRLLMAAAKDLRPDTTA